MICFIPFLDALSHTVLFDILSASTMMNDLSLSLSLSVLFCFVFFFIYLNKSSTTDMINLVEFGEIIIRLLGSFQWSTPFF